MTIELSFLEIDIPCNFCGYNDKKIYMVSDNIEWYLNEKFTLVECNNCGLVYAEPRPPFNFIRELYNDYEYAWTLLKRKLKRKFVKRYSRKRLDEILKFFPKAKSLFDVGVGAGTFLIEAKKRGLDVCGNDINVVSKDLLLRRKIYCYHCPTNLLETGRKYDIIVINDYLEHSYTPKNDLMWSYDSLNDNGILYIKTLFLGSPNHEKYGENWNLFDNSHFHYFDKRVLMGEIRERFTVERSETKYAIIEIIARKIGKEGK